LPVLADIRSWIDKAKFKYSGKEETIAALEKLGHDVELWPEKSWSMGAVCAILRDPSTGLLHAGADMRRPGYALAW